MRLFFDTASLTVSRSSEDSSPKTIRPLQSTTIIPSFVRVATFSCIRTLLCGPRQLPFRQDRSPLQVDAPAYRLRGGFSKLVRAHRAWSEVLAAGVAASSSAAGGL